MIPGTSKDKRKKGGEAEVTPAVIESAALEIIESANEILDMYGIDGSVVNLGLGLLPKQKKGKGNAQKYKTSFVDNDDYNLAVNYNRMGKKKNQPIAKRNGWKK